MLKLRRRDPQSAAAQDNHFRGEGEHSIGTQLRQVGAFNVPCGMSLRQINASLVIETGAYSILTAGLSAVFGRLLAGYLFKLIDPELMPALSWYSVAAIGGLVFALMFAAYIPTLLKLRRSSIAEDIRSKE